MAKTKSKVPAITAAAELAGSKLAAWQAVEANAKKIAAAIESEGATGNFAEFYFSGATVKGIVKAGQCVLKIES